jgi:D-aminoacyl-tRNA deacylase
VRAVIQRVSEASVEIENRLHASVKKGLLVLLGIEEGDTASDTDYLVSKISNMRIFSDNEGKMNLDLKQVNGEIMVISQFTLHASTKKGNRPSFTRAAGPGIAIPLYQQFLKELELQIGMPCQSGVFGADMKVKLINDGPVTIILDSRNRE